MNLSKKLVFVSVLILFSASAITVLWQLESNKEAGNSSNSGQNIADFAQVSNTPSLNVDRIPILFIGSEACPYCDAESWPIYYALETNGSLWTGLNFTYSSSSDKYPLTPGLDFANSSYQSKTVGFYGYEIYNANWKPYQKLNATDFSLFHKYDPNGNLPFVLIAGMYLHIGSPIDPTLTSGLNCSVIFDSLALNLTKPYDNAIYNESANIDLVLTTVHNAFSGKKGTSATLICPFQPMEIEYPVRP